MSPHGRRAGVQSVCDFQGDQIGRFFANWAIIFTLGSFLKITKIAQNVGLLTSTEKVVHLF
jgi:hypothetical protein